MHNYSNFSDYQQSDSFELVNMGHGNLFGIQMTFEQFLSRLHPSQPLSALLREKVSFKLSYDRNKTIERQRLCIMRFTRLREFLGRL